MHLASLSKVMELPDGSVEYGQPCTSNLQMYGIDTTNWDLIFILLCSDKLPACTVTLWEQTLSDKTAIPKRSHLNDFLYKRFRALESVSENRISEFPS